MYMKLIGIITLLLIFSPFIVVSEEYITEEDLEDQSEYLLMMVNEAHLNSMKHFSFYIVNETKAYMDMQNENNEKLFVEGVNQAYKIAKIIIVGFFASFLLALIFGIGLFYWIYIKHDDLERLERLNMQNEETTKQEETEKI